MPAKSESQRKLFAMVLAQKRGEMKNPSMKVKKVAANVTSETADDFATKKKREGLSQSLAGY